MHGARLDGNEFNIIAGQAYFTREFWTRKVEELGDVSAIDIKVGVKKEAIEVAYDGADSGVTDKTPDFIKSIPAWRIDTSSPYCSSVRRKVIST